MEYRINCINVYSMTTLNTGQVGSYLGKDDSRKALWPSTNIIYLWDIWDILFA